MRVDSSIKVKPQEVGLRIKNPPIFIVGQNPGHFKDGTHTGMAWEKNRSAKLLWEAIDKRKNLLLTNICNYTTMTKLHMDEGIRDIVINIEVMRPKTIICLGNIAYYHMMDIIKHKRMVDRGDIKIVKLYHPSYILRFQKDKNEWINSVREAIDG